MTLLRHAAVRWAIAAVLVVGVLSRFDLVAVGDRLASVDARLAVPAVAGLVAAHLIGALTWWRLVDRLAGARLDPRSTIRLYYAAQAVGSITPGNLGADLYRVVAVHGRAGAGFGALPIVVQRVTSIGALLALGAVGALVLPIAGGAPHVASIVLALAGLGAAVALLVSASRRDGGVAGRLLGRLGVHDGGQAGSTAWVSALRDGLGLGLVFHGVSLVLGFVLVAAVDQATASRPAEVLAALAVARLSLAVPISPSGLGIQEGALAVLFVGLGLAPEVALAAILLNRVALVVVVVGGAGALVSGRSAASSALPAGRPAGITDRQPPSDAARRPLDPVR